MSMRAAENGPLKTNAPLDRHASADEHSAVDEYLSAGYTIWPAAVPQPLLHRLCTAVDAIQAHATQQPDDLRELLLFERDLNTSHRNGIAADAVGDAIFIIGDPPRFDPVFRELLESPAIRRAAQALLGPDGLVAHFINVTIKQPRFGRAIGWHRDYPNTAYCTADSDFLRLMLCLDGMDADPGGTRFLPGSHRISDAQAASEKDNCTWPKPGPDEGTCLACAPGQLVAIHPKVLHGGGMNTSERPRRNIVIQIGKASAALTTDERDSLTGMLLG